MHTPGISFASATLLPENTVHVKFNDLAEVDIEEARTLKDLILKLSAGSKYVLILDSGKERIDISHEARDFLVQDEELNKDIVCQAYVARSMANKLIFHFFINFHKPDFPVQVFDDLSEAQKWIKKQRVAH